MSAMELPRKPVVLSVRFEEVLALCNHQIRRLAELSKNEESAGQSAGKLEDVSYRLRRWANEIRCSTSTGQASAIEVLEALDGKPNLAGKLHELLDAIAASLLKFTLSSSLNIEFESILENVAMLEHMIEDVRSQFQEILNDNSGEILRGSVVLCFGLQNSCCTSYTIVSDWQILDGGGVRSYSSLLILRRLMEYVQDATDEISYGEMAVQLYIDLANSFFSNE